MSPAAHNRRSVTRHDPSGSTSGEACHRPRVGVGAWPIRIHRWGAPQLATCKRGSDSEGGGGGGGRLGRRRSPASTLDLRHCATSVGGWEAVGARLGQQRSPARALDLVHRTASGEGQEAEWRAGERRRRGREGGRSIGTEGERAAAEPRRGWRLGGS